MTNRISGFQFHCLLMFMIMASTAIFEPPHFIKAGGPSSWLLVWFCAFAAAPYYLVYWLLASNNPTSFTALAESALGRYLGKAAVLVYLCFLVFSCALTIRMFFDFALSVTMFTVPAGVFAGLILASSAWAARKGLTVLGRLAEVFFWTNNLSAFLTVILSLKDIDPNNFLPLLSQGTVPLLPQAWKHSHVFSEAYLAFFLAPFTVRRDRIHLPILATLLLSAPWLCIFTLTAVGIFNHYLAQTLSYPIYSVARNVAVGEFIERADVLFVTIWISNAFVKSGLLLFVTAHTAAEVSYVRDYRVLVMPLTILTGALSMQMFANVAELKNFYDFFYYRVMMFFAVILPLILLVLLRWRKNEISAREVPRADTLAG